MNDFPMKQLPWENVNILIMWWRPIKYVYYILYSPQDTTYNKYSMLQASSCVNRISSVRIECSISWVRFQFG